MILPPISIFGWLERRARVPMFGGDSHDRECSRLCVCVSPTAKTRVSFFLSVLNAYPVT